MFSVIGGFKGGTGKSTITFNLAVWLSSVGKPVVCFDLDPQRTLADVVQVRNEQGYIPKFQVIDFAQNLPKKVEIIRRLNREMLADVGTADMAALSNAVAVADRILVPVGPSQADVWSTQRFMALVRELRGNAMPPVLGLINRADRAGEDTAEAEAALEGIPGFTRLPLRLYYRPVYRRSLSEGLAVFELAPDSQAAAELFALGEYLFR